MGLAPILHPPGRTVSARPSRARSGAQNRMDARICAAVWAGSVLFFGVPVTSTSLFCQRGVIPTPRRRDRQHSTSDKCGIARRQTEVRQSIDAAKIGSTLFFADGIRTVPFSGLPPVTRITLVFSAISAAPVSQKIPQPMQSRCEMSLWTSKTELVRLFLSSPCVKSPARPPFPPAAS